MPIYLQLERILKERNHAGVWQPDSKTPSELELASRLAVSRSTVGKVLDRLALDGRIQKGPSKGSHVGMEHLQISPTDPSFSRQMIAERQDQR